jgi:hypothetical protein
MHVAGGFDRILKPLWECMSTAVSAVGANRLLLVAREGSSGIRERAACGRGGYSTGVRHRQRCGDRG